MLFFVEGGMQFVVGGTKGDKLGVSCCELVVNSKRTIRVNKK